MPYPLSVTSFAVSGTNIFAGGGFYGSGVYLSTNNGASWTLESDDLGYQSVYSLAVSGSNIFAGTEYGVYLSTNNGTNWTNKNTGLGHLEDVLSVAVSPNGAGGANIFAGSNGNGVYLSTNNGTSWTYADNGMGYQTVTSLAVSGANIFAGANGGGVYLSTNNGTSWTVENAGLVPYVTSLAVSGANIFAGTGGYGVYLSTNNGTSWTAKNSGLGSFYISSVAVSGSNIFAGIGYGGGIYLSTNNGTSWTLDTAGMGNQYVSSFAVSGSNIFAGISNVVYLSTNNGTSWTLDTAGMGNQYVSSFAVSGANIFAGTSGNGVYLSTNNGTSWTLNGLSGYSANSLAVSGWNIFAGTNSGVYLSTLSSTVDVSLNSNWNLISIPVQVQNDTLSALFPTHKSNAFGYNGSGYVIDNQLNVGTGYWLKFASATSDSFVGSPLTFDSVAVTNGWNLIGSLSLPLAATSITSNPPGMITSKFFGYAGSYKTTDTLYPGKGYWVKVNNAGTLILSSGSSASLAKNTSNSRIRIIPTGEMPPTPPSEDGTPSDLPKEFALEQNYPNPFNPTTMLRYALPIDSKVRLKVYNVFGQVVTTLTDGAVSAGYQSTEWSASNVASGIYFYRIEATSVTNPSKIFTQVKKMVLMK